MGRLDRIPKKTHQVIKQRQREAERYTYLTHLTHNSFRIGITSTHILTTVTLIRYYTRLKAAGKPTAKTGFKGSDLMSDTLSYVDIPAQTVYCTPHGVWGAVKDLIKSISGKAYGRNRRTNERKFNPARAAYLDQHSVKVTEATRSLVDFLVSTKMVQPGGRRHDAMRPPFEGI